MKRPLGMRATIVGFFFVATSLLAQARDAAISGDPGGGGQPFRRECPEREFVVGVNGTTGKWIDGIQIVCAQVSEGSTFFGPHALDGIGSYKPTSSQYVGCPKPAFNATADGESAVRGVRYGLTRLDDNRNGFVDSLNIACNHMKAPAYAAAQSQGLYSAGGDQKFCRKEISTWGMPYEPECGSRNAILASECHLGEFVSGVYGRAGLFIDVLGVICTQAPVLQPGHSNLGRGKIVPPPYGTTSVATATVPNNRAVAHRPGQTATAGTQLPGAATANGESLPSIRHPLPSRANIAGNRASLGGMPAQGQQLFAPPAFEDGAHLWACDGAADQACDGRAAAIAWCTSQGFASVASSTPPALFERSSARVRSVSGETCEAATCAMIESVTCAR